MVCVLCPCPPGVSMGHSFIASANERACTSWLLAWWSLQVCLSERQTWGILMLWTTWTTWHPALKQHLSQVAVLVFLIPLSSAKWVCRWYFGGLWWWCGQRASEDLNDLFGGLCVLSGGGDMPQVSISPIERVVSLGVWREGRVCPVACHFETVRRQTLASHSCTPSPETEASVTVLINNWWTGEGASAKSEAAWK